MRFTDKTKSPDEIASDIVGDWDEGMPNAYRTLRGSISAAITSERELLTSERERASALLDVAAEALQACIHDAHAMALQIYEQQKGRHIDALREMSYAEAMHRVDLRRQALAEIKTRGESSTGKKSQECRQCFSIVPGGTFPGVCPDCGKERTK